MALSDLLDRIKAALGIGATRGKEPRSRPSEEGTTGGRGQPTREPNVETTEATTAEEGTTVTVEREPSTESEDAVKGTDTSTESDVDMSGESETASGSAAEERADAEAGTSPEETDTAGETSEEATDESVDEQLGTDEPTDVIKGIGPTYADRLAEAGVETVADLATSEAESLAEQTEISETRIGNWIERAKHR